MRSFLTKPSVALTKPAPKTPHALRGVALAFSSLAFIFGSMLFVAGAQAATGAEKGSENRAENGAMDGPEIVQGKLNGVDITGAGSSFAAPVYQGWSLPIGRELGIGVNYQSIGSSAGQDQVSAGTVDFGASDKPMPLARLKATHLYQFPTVMSGVVVIVNLPGVKPGALRLDGPTLAAIYDGDITQWNDPRLRALNPGLALPDELIAAVHRADGSGTTYVFTSYLSQLSSRWRDLLGAGTLVGWPGGDGARGNDGVAAIVRQVPWSIGYVEYAYAAQNHLDMARLKNRDGQFVLPTLEGFAAAAASAVWPVGDKLGGAVDLLDRPGADTWPIVTATYALVPEGKAASRTGQAVRAFFDWGFAHGGELTARLGYVGLPENVRAGIMAGWPHPPQKQN